jgi:hypothetical protein
MSKIFTTMLIAIALGAWPAIGWCNGPSQNGPSQDDLRSLDEQVQEIKSDVLGIASELSLLEERLLYPSNTQVSVFVSLAEAEAFRLDAVRILIDGELAAHHIYSFKELDALASGGMQRIYTGNLTTGDHRLEVSVVGKTRSGKDYAQTESFSFSKDIEPALLGLALAGPAAGSSAIQLNDW